MKRSYTQKETESTFVAAQEQALCIRNVRNVVCEENVQSICLVCGVADETVVHIMSKCSKLAQEVYK